MPKSSAQGKSIALIFGYVSNDLRNSDVNLCSK